MTNIALFLVMSLVWGLTWIAAKAGVSADLDALAAYVASLNSFATSPYRTSTGALSTAATAGKTLFTNLGCGTCHAGAAAPSCPGEPNGHSAGPSAWNAVRGPTPRTSA